MISISVTLVQYWQGNCINFFLMHKTGSTCVKTLSWAFCIFKMQENYENRTPPSLLVKNKKETNCPKDAFFYNFVIEFLGLKKGWVLWTSRNWMRKFWRLYSESKVECNPKMKLPPGLNNQEHVLVALTWRKYSNSSWKYFNSSWKYFNSSRLGEDISIHNFANKKYLRLHWYAFT